MSNTAASSTPLAQHGEYGFPIGHLGFLTTEQTQALDEFRKIVIEEGLVTPSRNGEPPSHNDATLLRFLRARRFVAEDAAEQFRETEKWRQINHLDDLYMNIDVDDYEETRRVYTHSVGRRDKRGVPVYLFRIGALDSQAMSTYTKSTESIRGLTADGKALPQGDTAPKLLRLFTTIENLTTWMTQLCTVLSDRPNPEVPITQSNNIVDISNVGLRQFWGLRNHMQDATNIATAHFPETLDRIFIIGAPSFFPTIWSFIKKIFDPITASKIFILSEAEVLPTLSQYIEPENIPARYGGKLEFEFGDSPTIDPAYADRLIWHDDKADDTRNSHGVRRWPRGPVKWIRREDGDWDLLAVGSVASKPRRDFVATLKLNGYQRGGWADESMPDSKHNECSDTKATGQD